MVSKITNTPLLIAIVTAVVGLLGTGVGAIIQGFNDTNLERQKFESQLVSKALESEHAQGRADYLKFLVELDLVNGLNRQKIDEYVEKPESIPRAGPALDIDAASESFRSKGEIPGHITFGDTFNWKSWGKDGATLAASLNYFNGRILAYAHDGALDPTKDLENLQVALKWLIERSTHQKLLFTSAHCEWYPNKYSEKSDVLKDRLSHWGYEVGILDSVISKEHLESAGILVIGNGWGGFSQEEIEVVRQFVSSGGGLFMVGLGWSWKKYSAEDFPKLKCEHKTLDQDKSDLTTYPMNRIAAPYELRWTGLN